MGFTDMICELFFVFMGISGIMMSGLLFSDLLVWFANGGKDKPVILGRISDYINNVINSIKDK